MLVAIILVLDWYFGFASQTGQMVSGPLPPVNGWSSISLVTRSSECRRCREKKDGTVSQPKTFVIEIFTFVCVLGDLITSLNCVNVWFITLFFGNFGKSWDCERPLPGWDKSQLSPKQNMWLYPASV